MDYGQKLRALKDAYRDQDLWREVFGDKQGRLRWDVLRDLPDDPEAIAYVDKLYAKLTAGRGDAQERIKQEAVQEQARLQYEGQGVEIDPDNQDISSGLYQYVITKVPPSQIKERTRLGAMQELAQRVAARYLQARDHLDINLFKKMLLKNRALLRKRATIPHPPRRGRQYFKNMARKLEEVVKQIKALERSLTGGGETITDDYMGDSPLWISPYDLKRIYQGGRWDDGSLTALGARVADFVSEIDGTSNPESSEYDQRRYWGFFQKSLKHVIEDLSKGSGLPYVVNDVLEKKTELRDFAEYQESDYVEEGLPKGFTDSLFKLVDLVEQAKQIALEAKPKLDEYVRLYLTGWQKQEDARPPSEDMETLYHTSVNARRLFAKGFDPVVPKTDGLGGSQEDKSGKAAISFTSDLYVAKEIMRTLREAIMVAKGQVRVDHILEWSKRGGVLDAVLKTFKNSHGEIEPRKAYHVMYLYRYYLAYMGSKGKRYDPLFFGDMEKLMKQFKRLNSRDVGILACSVNMADPNIIYMASMHEYRVSPQSVVSIDKLIS